MSAMSGRTCPLGLDERFFPDLDAALAARRAISRREMRGFLSELAVCFHERAPQAVCVGLASARWRSLLDALPLDFEQVHWYESLDSLTALAWSALASDTATAAAACLAALRQVTGHAQTARLHA